MNWLDPEWIEKELHFIHNLIVSGTIFLIGIVILFLVALISLRDRIYFLEEKLKVRYNEKWDLPEYDDYVGENNCVVLVEDTYDIQPVEINNKNRKTCQ